MFKLLIKREFRMSSDLWYFDLTEYFWNPSTKFGQCFGYEANSHVITVWPYIVLIICICSGSWLAVKRATKNIKGSEWANEKEEGKLIIKASEWAEEKEEGKLNIKGSEWADEKAEGNLNIKGSEWADEKEEGKLNINWSEWAEEKEEGKWNIKGSEWAAKTEEGKLNIKGSE